MIQQLGLNRPLKWRFQAMPKILNDTGHDTPLPIVSVRLECVNAEGRTATIGRGLDFTQAEDLLRTWAHTQTGNWPDGSPIRVAVEFPRRLIFTCDLIADSSGRVRKRISSRHQDRPDFSAAGLMSLQDHVAVALRLAYASREISVESLQAQRVARIVLAYGDPA